MGDANINRGKKWVEEIRQLELKKQPKEIEWINSQPAIVADIEEYNLSINPNTDVSFSDKKKAELKKACDEAGLEYDDTSTKDDLVVLLENKADADKEA